MLAVQPMLPFPRPGRQRNRRGPFTPRPADRAPYKLPKGLSERLAGALAGFRNRESAFALATFIARYWSSPARITGPFPIDRRALADHVDLGLTEAQVRGAIHALEAIGFLHRLEPEPGKRYQPTVDGLHRRAMLFHFGQDYLPDFLAANKRAAAARGGRSRRDGATNNKTASRPSTALPEARRTNSPKSKSKAVKKVVMGEMRIEKRAPSAPTSDPRLEAALDRWSRALRREPARLAAHSEMLTEPAKRTASVERQTHHGA